MMMYIYMSFICTVPTKVLVMIIIKNYFVAQCWQFMMLILTYCYSPYTAKNLQCVIPILKITYSSASH